jgi:hypothetical protein
MKYDNGSNTTKLVQFALIADKIIDTRSLLDREVCQSVSLSVCRKLEKGLVVCSTGSRTRLADEYCGALTSRSWVHVQKHGF